jgi:hypothetical protein
MERRLLKARPFQEEEGGEEHARFSTKETTGWKRSNEHNNKEKIKWRSRIFPTNSEVSAGCFNQSIHPSISQSDIDMGFKLAHYLHACSSL